MFGVGMPADLSSFGQCLRAAADVRACDRGWRSSVARTLAVGCRRLRRSRIEIELAGARLTMIGSVAPELAQAVVTALRVAGDRSFPWWSEDHGCDATCRLPARCQWPGGIGGISTCG